MRQIEVLFDLAMKDKTALRKPDDVLTRDVQRYGVADEGDPRGIHNLYFGCISCHVDDIGKKWQLLIPRWISKKESLTLVCGRKRVELLKDTPVIFNNTKPHYVLPTRLGKVLSKGFIQKIKVQGDISELDYANYLDIPFKYTNTIMCKATGIFVESSKDRKWLKDNTNTIFL